MLTKKEQLVSAIQRADYKEALSITKGFRREFSPQDQRVLQIAYETLTGKGNFYSSIGIDIENNMKMAIELLKNYE